MKKRVCDKNRGNENFTAWKIHREKQLKYRVLGSIILIAAIICFTIIPINRKETSEDKIMGKTEVKAVSLMKDSMEQESITVVKRKESCIERRVDFNKPMIALTFDDGPGLRTMELLNILEYYDARATFFMCGNNLSRKDINVDCILKKMDKIGCEISNHTMNHMQLSILSAKNIKRQVEGVNQIIESHTGHGAASLRPPYGSGIHSKKVINTVGLPMIYWSIDTLDWKTKSKKDTVKAVLKKAGDGDIVLMHDIHTWSVDAAIEIIPKLIKKGYQLVTVSEMAAARGVELENGKTYFSFYP